MTADFRDQPRAELQSELPPLDLPGYHYAVKAEDRSPHRGCSGRDRNMDTRPTYIHTPVDHRDYQ